MRPIKENTELNPSGSCTSSVKEIAGSHQDCPMVIFDEARKLFPSRRPGAKRGNEVEFKNFCRHKDWRQCLPLLKAAILREIKWREETAKLNSKQKDRDKIIFIPEWPNFSVWINQRRWENEFELPSEKVKSKPVVAAVNMFKSVPNYSADEAKAQQARRVQMRKDLFIKTGIRI